MYLHLLLFLDVEKLHFHISWNFAKMTQWPHSLTYKIKLDIYSLKGMQYVGLLSCSFLLSFTASKA